MKFPSPLLRGKLIKRYKRFLADILLEDGETITAHCANPGSMLGLKEEGAKVWVSKAVNPKRKLRYDWQLIEADNTLVAIHTGNPNKIVEEALINNQIDELGHYETLKREVKYGDNSRIDLLLSDNRKADCFVEVKNVHLSRKKGLVEFPDSVTARGAKHLAELSKMVEQGHRAVMFFLVQRADGNIFKLAQDIDVTYAKAFDNALKKGVEAICYQCHIDLKEITVEKKLPIIKPSF